MAEEAENAAVAFLLRLDPATQCKVIDRYEEALQVELDTDGRRLRRVAVAFHQTRRTLGRSPSIREYKRLRHEHPERGWPDPRSITRWLGVRSWNDALVRMRLEPVLEGDVIEGAIGPTYSIDEVIQAVRQCAEDLGRAPTITEYLGWQRRPDVRHRPGRRPASTWVFNRIFGGFPPARVAAGLVEGEATSAHPSELVLRTANYRLSSEQILADLREVAARANEPVTATVYDRERRLLYQETKAVGRPRALAGVGSIYRHFGSWPAALTEAGIAVAVRVRTDRPWLDDRQLLRALADAGAATTGRLTIQQYLAWRQRQLTDDARRRIELPSYVTIYRRFGSWRAALRAAAVDFEGAHNRAAGHRVASVETLPVTERDKQLLRALTEAAADTPGALTVLRFLSWRERQIAAEPNRRAELPGHSTIYRRFGSFPAALNAAGLDVEQMTGRVEGVRFSNEQILHVLEEADVATHGQLSVAHYLAWREEQSAGDPALRRALPTYTTILQRFGSWTKALESMRRSRST